MGAGAGGEWKFENGIAALVRCVGPDGARMAAIVWMGRSITRWSKHGYSGRGGRMCWRMVWASEWLRCYAHTPGGREGWGITVVVKMAHM